MSLSVVRLCVFVAAFGPTTQAALRRGQPNVVVAPVPQGALLHHGSEVTQERPGLLSHLAHMKRRSEAKTKKGDLEEAMDMQEAHRLAKNVLKEANADASSIKMDDDSKEDNEFEEGDLNSEAEEEKIDSANAITVAKDSMQKIISDAQAAKDDLPAEKPITDIGWKDVAHKVKSELSHKKMEIQHANVKKSWDAARAEVAKLENTGAENAGFKLNHLLADEDDKLYFWAKSEAETLNTSGNAFPLERVAGNSSVDGSDVHTDDVDNQTSVEVAMQDKDDVAVEDEDALTIEKQDKEEMNGAASTRVEDEAQDSQSNAKSGAGAEAQATLAEEAAAEKVAFDKAVAKAAFEKEAKVKAEKAEAEEAAKVETEKAERAAAAKAAKAVAEKEAAIKKAAAVAAQKAAADRAAASARKAAAREADKAAAAAARKMAAREAAAAARKTAAGRAASAAAQKAAEQKAAVAKAEAEVAAAIAAETAKAVASKIAAAKAAKIKAQKAAAAKAATEKRAAAQKAHVAAVRAATAKAVADAAKAAAAANLSDDEAAAQSQADLAEKESDKESSDAAPGGSEENMSGSDEDEVSSSDNADKEIQEEIEGVDNESEQDLESEVEDHELEDVPAAAGLLQFPAFLGNLRGKL